VNRKPETGDCMEFFFLLLTSGLLIGLMYALIALGFVLIYKASDAINFAQGEMVMFAGLLVSVAMTDYGLPLIIAIVLGMGLMIIFGLLVERVMLRPLIGRPIVAIIMATIGLAAILRGLGPMLWGASTKPLELPISDAPIDIFGLPVPVIHLVGAGMSFVLLAACSYFFLKNRIGIALRAVADNQQTALAMGIDVKRYFAIAWIMAGIVSAIGGIIWGNLLGVDVHLALVGLKVFPVVILGGLDSIPGAIIGGLLVGGIESVAAGYIDPYVGGGTKDFIPYIIMVLALMIRPYGIFGEEIIERV
jgi:branched-chain amino acid transport system permease protein